MKFRTAGFVFGLFAAVLCLVPLFFAGSVPIGIVRTAVIVQAAVIAVGALRPVPDARLLTPLFVLPVTAVVFFIVSPAIYALTGPGPMMPEDVYRRIITYPGSGAEFVVLQFASVLLLVAALLPPTDASVSWGLDTLPKAARTRAVAVLLALAAATAIAKAAATHFLALEAIGLGRMAGEVSGMLAPACFFCLAGAVVLTARDSFKTLAVALAVAGACILAFLLSDLARRPLAFVAFVIGLILIIRAPRIRRFALVCGSALLAIAIVAAAANTYRALTLRGEGDPAGRHFLASISYKLMVRQTTSGWCLEQARQRHWDGGGASHYENFVSGLVPRVFWPGKPSLSRGTEYAVEYCRAKIDPKRPHSEALTLVAEPIMEGGRTGLLVGGMLIVAFAGLASVAMLRTGTVGLAAGTALLPWLAAFEDHLAFYVANSTKTFLIILPLALLLHLYLRRARRETGASRP